MPRASGPSPLALDVALPVSTTWTGVLGKARLNYAAGMNRRLRGPSTHVLIAGDERDLPVIIELAAALPDDAYGQILLETPAAPSAPSIPAPDRVSVQWLPRQVGNCPGHRLADSLSAWAHEWLVDEDRDLHGCHHLFIGAGGCRPVDVVREVHFVGACLHLESLSHLTISSSVAPGA